MKIKDTTAIAILEALGYQTASKWDLSRLNKKMNNLPDLITDDIEIDDEKLMEVMDRVLDSIESGKEIIVAKKKKDKNKDKKKNKGKKTDRATGKKVTKNKDKKKDKSKGKDKKKAKNTGTSKPGVIASIIEIIEKHGPISKASIVKRLAKRFPEREPERMAKTVGVQVPSRLRSDKSIEVVCEDGKYSIE